MQVNELIRNMIDRELDDLHVALPARIIKYNAQEMRADIQLLSKQKLGDQEVEMPRILEVPVSHFKAGPFIIRPSYQKDDVVQVLFNEKALDNLLVDSHPRRVELKRKHGFDDAVIVSGLKTERESNYPSSNAEDFLICNTSTNEKVILKKDGGVIIESDDIKLGSENASESLATKSELNDLKELVLSHGHPFIDITPNGSIQSTTQATTSTKIDYPGTSKVVAE